MAAHFVDFLTNRTHPLFLPIGINGGLSLTPYTIDQIVHNSACQAETALAGQQYFQSEILQTGMDLSVEAEAFGAAIRFSRDEVPTVIGRLVTTTEEITALQIPFVGTKRTAICLETGRLLSESSRHSQKKQPVLGGVCGPFSLASRLFGVSQTLEISLLQPNFLQQLLEKTTCFLTDYIHAFRENGCQGVIMAEPSAGLLSPHGMSKFSSLYIRQIMQAVETPDFTLIVHNCGAKSAHLKALKEIGARVYHFGKPMDMFQALKTLGPETAVGGNLDPTEVFFSGSTHEILSKTKALLETTQNFPNFFLSSGCDIPPGTPPENLKIVFDLLNTNY